MSGWLVPLEVPVDVDRSEAQRRALAELAKAKYGGLPGFVTDAFDRLLEILQQISDFLSGIGGTPGAGGVGPGFVVAVVVLLVALGLVIWKVGLPRLARRSARGDELALDAARPAADYRARAEEAARDGQWAAAVRDRFRALVRDLEVRTVIDARPARTAWEAALAAQRVLPDRSSDLFTGADLFSAVSYGDRPATEADYRSMIEIDGRVIAAADRTDLAGAGESTEPADRSGSRR